VSVSSWHKRCKESNIGVAYIPQKS
jgi:hypothetical protein